MSTHISTNKLANTRVLIVGGTSGIGFAVARVALEHGASIIVASSKSDKVNSAITRLKSFYPDEEHTNRIAGTVCNLADRETLEANTTDAPDGKVLLDHVVMTAGDALNLRKPTDPTFDVPFIESSGTVRFIGSLILAKHAPTYVRQTSSSSLTFTSGVLAARPAPGWTLAAATGTAIEGMARGLAVDLAPIRVNTVAPGAVLTEIFGTLETDNLEKMVEMFRSQTLTGEIGKPEDVAEAYLYLMKDRFVTGELLASNGGRLLK
ncbi:oxidoreductase [Aspergillus bombycis]|uniref:Oxidoreductase n=1 Tax=Aspergillus bombycis TaxID=109264 RepID=A0A1F8AG97_9EURO|nr:oxidoreductase [Aspergillus bombycis]OGM50711.1 oxidoreductase [Aspergillus bombycis]